MFISGDYNKCLQQVFTSKRARTQHSTSSIVGKLDEPSGCGKWAAHNNFLMKVSRLMPGVI